VVAEAGSAPEPIGGPLDRLLARIQPTGALRGLRHRSYFTLWSTLLVTQVGFWMCNVSLQWSVAKATDNDSFALGLLYFCNLIPILLFAPIAGVMADRFERKRIVTLSQAAIGCLAAGLVVVLTMLGGYSNVAVLLVFAFGLGTALALNAPANAAVMVNSVPRADVSSAVALQSVGLNLSRVAGPGLATPLLAAWGPRPAFAIFAATSIFSSYVVSRLRLRPVTLSHAEGGPFRRINQGFRVARERPPALLALSMVAVTAVFASSYVSQLPVFAYEILEGGDRTFTMLFIVTGVGAAAGALMTSSQSRLQSLRAVGIEVILMGVALVGFAASRVEVVSLVLAAVIAYFNFSVMTNLQTTLQYLAPEQVRGRIMSLYIMAWGGMLPLGTLAIGALGAVMGAPAVIVGSATVAVVFAIGIVLKGPRIAPEMLDDDE
jgi:MFS family permease